ncbi:MAG: MFS transporter [Gammaproteobacteria bacterium]|nr:MFS transporter [Gammaproteobacteria bacterium]
MQRTINLSRRYFAHYSHLSKECWQGTFLIFIQSLATGTCYFLSLYFVNVLNISIAASGLLISAYGVGNVFGSLFSGKLSDMISAKRISNLTLFIQALAFFLLTQFSNENILLMIMFVNGFCAYGFITSNNVWLLKGCQNQPEMRLKIINIRRAAANLGMGVSGLMIGFLTLQQFPLLFNLMSAALIFSAFYLHFFVNDKNDITILNNNINKISSSLSINNYHKKIILLILLCVFLINLIIAQLSITYPIYIQQLFPQMGTQSVSILFILDTLLIVFFQTPLVNNLKNFNKILFVGIGAFLMGAGMYLLNFSSFFYIAIISCLIWTTGEMIFISMAQFVCYEAGSEQKKGHTMGAFQATTAVAKIIGPAMGAYIYHVLGPNTLWSSSMIIGIFCFLMCFYFRKHDFIY